MSVIHGDCLEVMRTLEEASVDAVVCDPPAGIAFMGKAWDHDKGGRDQWIEWLASVMRECYRVMKPGAHALVWALPRTSHWTGMALEDAGFEVRDRVTHLFGSGFPKSLDISKAMDKRRDDRADILRVTSFVADAAERVGISRADVDAHMGTSDMGGWWLSRLTHRCQCPQWDQWLQLKALLGCGDEMDAEVWRLNGRKGQPGEAWHEREVIGVNENVQRAARIVERNGGGEIGFGAGSLDDRLTAPATDLAKQWAGWGTALKPSHETWWMVQKPYDVTQLCGILARNLQESICRLPSLVRDAGGSSTSSLSACVGDADSALWRAVERCSSPDDLYALMATSRSEWAMISSLSIGWLWLNTLAAISEHASMFTTEMASGLTTDLKILNSSRLKITPDTIIQAAIPTSGIGSNAANVASIFSGVRAKLQSILTLSAHELATRSGEGAAFLDPGPGAAVAQDGATAGLPDSADIWLCRKPLVGTVASTVSAYGTGGLNIGACRIGYQSEADKASATPQGKCVFRPGRMAGDAGDGSDTVEGLRSPQVGRWPANVVLSHSPECRQVGTRRVKSNSPSVPQPKFGSDKPGVSLDFKAGVGRNGDMSSGYADADGLETVPAWECSAKCAVAALDAQSGELKSGSGAKNGGTGNGWEGGPLRPIAGDWSASSGGASRFFYTAKASRREREAGLEGMPTGNGVVQNGSGRRFNPICDRSGKRIQECECGACEWSPETNPKVRNSHPTVKPLALMRWLCRLITPPGGLILDPFCGSGSTGCAAALEGFRFLGIEREPEYADIARKRIAYWTRVGARYRRLLAYRAAHPVERPAPKKDPRQGGLFAESVA